MASQGNTGRGNTWQVVGIYLLTFAGRGYILPFLSLYLVSVGFSGTNIGTLVGLSALVQLVVTPALNTLADRTNQHKVLLNGWFVANFLTSLGLIAFANPIWLGGMYVLRDLSDMPNAALLAQLTLTRLKLQERGEAIFGRLRAFGSLGWALTTLSSGYIFMVGGYKLLFILAGLFNLLAVPLARVLPSHTAASSEPMVRPPRRRGFYLLAFSIFLFSSVFVTSWTFGLVYFQQALGADNTMIGIIASVAALAEIPVMLTLDRILRRVDVRTTLALGFIGLTLILFSYTFLEDTSLLIPLMIVRGTVYTLYVVSLTLLVSQISHPANAATNQALIQVTVPGLGVLLTAPLSGWIFDHFGAHTLFQIVGVIGLLAALVLIAGRRHLTPMQASRDTEMDAVKVGEAVLTAPQE
jgi:PPP family 3-phenylpropionic acid transporter